MYGNAEEGGDYSMTEASELLDRLAAQTEAINALAESVGLLAQATAALLAEARYEEMPEEGDRVAAAIRTLDG